MELAELFGRLGAGLGIGLLVGLQREYAKEGSSEEMFAGSRTFALLGLGGGLSAYGSWLFDNSLIFVAALLVTGVFVAMAYQAGLEEGEVGQTTEIAAIVVFLTGGLAVVGDLIVSAAAGVATMTLLAIKPQTRKLASKIDSDDVYATVKFAILVALILPLLPRETFGPSPWNATSPFNVGLMVVFISGLSFVGYVLIQVVGPRRGTGLTGLLGGLVSSTAVTISMSERSQNSTGLERPLALAILLAWTIMFVRVIIEVAAVNFELLSEVWLPMSLGALGGLAIAAFLYFRRGEATSDGESNTFSNPFRLRPAIEFGLIYGVVLVVAKAASEWLGEAGVYASAVVSGIADVDAITLSLAELSRGDGSVEDSTAGAAIALAAATNTLVKGGIVLAVGSARLRKVALPALVVIVVSVLGSAFLF